MTTSNQPDDSAVEIRAAWLAQRKQAEHDQAAELLISFAFVARRALESQWLRVADARGRSARTGLPGWYLRRDRGAGLGTDGRFYILRRPLTIVDRLRGIKLEPSPPPMVLGAGGKDGQSIDLVDALERLLPGWRHRGE